MKLTTFCVDTPIGPFERFGLVKLDGGAKDVVSSARAGSGWVIDANVAYAAFLAHRGKPNASVRADRFCPADLNTCVQIYGPALDPLLEMAEWLDQRLGVDCQRSDALAVGKVSPIGYDVKLRPPIRVPVLRDFAAFEDHLQVTFGKMGLKIPPEWYDRPIAFKGNPTSLVGHDEPVRWPQYTQKLDYELELAAVIGLPARDVDVARGRQAYSRLHVAERFLRARYATRRDGHEYRALQRKGLRLGFGSVDCHSRRVRRSRRDENEGAGQRRGVGSVNARRDAMVSFPEMIAYTSQDETANVGDVFGSGTVNNGCGFEIDRWISPGDVVEIEAATIGVLRNRIEPARGKTVEWRRNRLEHRPCRKRTVVTKIDQVHPKPEEAHNMPYAPAVSVMEPGGLALHCGRNRLAALSQTPACAGRACIAARHERADTTRVSQHQNGARRTRSNVA